jgi:hypothetical protein
MCTGVNVFCDWEGFVRVCCCWVCVLSSDAAKMFSVHIVRS